MRWSRWIASFFVFAVAVSSAVCVRAQTNASPSARKELTALYARIFRIANDRTEESLLTFLQQETMPDWSDVDSTGASHSRNEQIQVVHDVVAGRGTADPGGKISGQIDQILDENGTTIVRSRLTWTSTETDPDGRYGQPGRSHRITHIVPYRDTWIKTASGWRWKLAEEGDPQLIIDGKPFKN